MREDVWRPAILAAEQCVRGGHIASAANPRVRQALEQLDDAFTSAANTAWQGLLDVYRLRMRPPYQVRHLTASIAGLLNGFYIHSIVRPQALGDPAGDPEWSLVTRTAVALFEQITEPE